MSCYRLAQEYSAKCCVFRHLPVRRQFLFCCRQEVFTLTDYSEAAEADQSALTDEEWALVESAQQKLEAEEEELTPDEEAAIQKAIDAGELEVEDA